MKILSGYILAYIFYIYRPANRSSKGQTGGTAAVGTNITAPPYWSIRQTDDLMRHFAIVQVVYMFYYLTYFLQPIKLYFLKMLISFPRRQCGLCSLLLGHLYISGVYAVGIAKYFSNLPTSGSNSVVFPTIG